MQQELLNAMASPHSIRYLVFDARDLLGSLHCGAYLEPHIANCNHNDFKSQ